MKTALKKEGHCLQKKLRKCFGNIWHTITEEPGLIIWAKEFRGRRRIAAVYTRCKRSLPWMLEIGLEMIQIDKVLPEDVGIERLMPNKNDDDSEVTEWSDLEEDGMEDDVLDLDWEEITTRKKFNLNFI
ncbi:hypothetical protein CEXT_613231 [Caerostris extrusa]|uniref:Uncharacterized protein n=1 Tax=Caerostris extrusa TaxID=172846 RepID=A0AAV4RRN9_CAEEX|nr:hypothetical protein CEXT_613231 [Caerostris extrusa]